MQSRAGGLYKRGCRVAFLWRNGKSTTIHKAGINMVKKNVLLITIFAIILCGCAKKTTGAEIDNLIQLSFPHRNTLSQNNELDVLITNNSEQCIVFPKDFGLQIYMKRGNDIVKLKENGAYIGDDIKLEPVGQIFSENIITFGPDLSSVKVTSDSSFYATIEGHLCNDEKTIINKTIPFSVSPN